MNKPAILLVDDNRMDVELAIDAFREANFSNRVEVVGSGQQALDYLFGRDAYADRASHPLPALVLLDLKMPGVDGFEVLRRIKEEPMLRRIPVVILTSSREEGDRARSYDIGANSYLLKPVSFTNFIEVVKQLKAYWMTLNVAPPLPFVEEEGIHGDE